MCQITIKNLFFPQGHSVAMITTLLELVGNLVQEHQTHGPSILQNPTAIPQFNQLSEHLSKIDLQHVGIDLDNLDCYFKKDANTYFNILEEQEFSVGVFCLTKGRYTIFYMTKMI